MGTGLGRVVLELVTDASKFFRGLDDAKKEVGGLGKSLQSFGKSATSVGKSLSFGLTAPLVGVGAAALKVGTDFNAAMANVATLIPGAGDRIKELKGDVQGLAIETGKATEDLADGLYQVISAFGDTADTAAKLEITAKAAAAGLATTTEAIDLTSGVTKAYGDTTAEAVQKAADLALMTVRLGQCVVGSTRVLCADGRFERIDRLQDGANVLSFDGRAFVVRPATWIDQGVKPTVTVRTRSGREIVTTWNHPYLTIRREGRDVRSTRAPKWRKVSDLSIGDRIAVPAATPVFGDVDVSDAEAAFLGLWLAEGSGGATSPRVTSTAYGEQIRQWVEPWGCSIKNVERRPGKAPTWEIAADTKGHPNGNPAMARLRSYGLADCKARDKHVPEQVFLWRRDKLAIFLRWLFNGDGWLADKRSDASGKRQKQLGFCSASEQLVRDVAHLLLRFGVLGRVRRREGKWSWETQRSAEVARFLAFIGIDRPGTSGFLVTKKEHRTWGVVEFDPIVAIEGGSDERVYDLSVAELHNFIANDIVAHNTTFPDLAASMGRVTPIAQSLGQSQEDLFAVFATATGVTGGAAEVATQYRGVLAALLKPTADLAGLLERQGFASGQAMLEQKGLVGTLQEIVAAAEASGKPITSYISSIEAVPLALALAGPQATDFATKLAEMGKAAGTTDVAFREQSEGVNAAGFAWAQFKQEVVVIAQQLGDVLLPVVLDAAKSIRPLVDVVKNAVTWFRELPQPVQTAMVVAAGLAAALGPVLIVVGQVAAAIGALMPVITAVGGVLAALATGPVAIVVAAIVGLVAAWVAWGDDIKRIVSETVQAVKAWLVDWWNDSIFKSVFEMLKALAELYFAAWGRVIKEVGEFMGALRSWLIDKLQPIIEALRPVIAVFTTIWTTAKDTIVGIVTAIYNAIKTWILDKLAGIVQGVKEKIDAVTGFFRDMKDKIVGHSYVPELVDGIGFEFGRLPAVMVTPAQASTAAVLDAFSGLTAQVPAALSGLVDAIGETFGTKISGIFSGFASGPLAGLFNAMDDMFGGRLSSIVSQGTQIFQSGLRAASGVARLFAGDFTGLVDTIAGGWEVIKGIGSKIGSFFGNLFGGPSAAEKAGREITKSFNEVVNNIWGNIKDRVEPVTEQWQRNLIAIREAYIASGMGAEEAGKRAEEILARLWESEKQGGAATQRVMDEIVDVLQVLGTEGAAAFSGVGAAAADAASRAARAFSGLRIDIPVNFDPGEVKVPEGGEIEPPAMSFQEGTHGRFVDFGRGTLAMLHGREMVVPEAEAFAPGLGGLRALVVPVQLHGREIARVVVDDLPAELARRGVVWR